MARPIHKYQMQLWQLNLPSGINCLADQCKTLIIIPYSMIENARHKNKRGTSCYQSSHSMKTMMTRISRANMAVAHLCFPCRSPELNTQIPCMNMSIRNKHLIMIKIILGQKTDLPSFFTQFKVVAFELESSSAKLGFFANALNCYIL